MKKLLLCFLAALFTVAPLTAETLQAHKVPTQKERREFAKKLFGRVRFVESGEDVRIKFVSFGEDLRVRIYDLSCVPRKRGAWVRKPGSWAICERDEQVRVRVVQSGEQVRVLVTDCDEGLRRKIDGKSKTTRKEPKKKPETPWERRQKFARTFSGQIDFVESGEHARVRFVESSTHADLRVQFRPPSIIGRRPGQWSLGNGGPLRVKIVERGEDFTACVIDSGRTPNN